jgi:hypothetical protein
MVITNKLVLCYNYNISLWGMLEPAYTSFQKSAEKCLGILQASN